MRERAPPDWYMLPENHRSDRNSCPGPPSAPGLAPAARGRGPAALEVVAGAVEVLEQLLAIGPHDHERGHEPFLARRLQPDEHRARVRIAGRAGDEARRLGPVDELGHRALSELEVLAELADRARLAAVGRALDGQEQEVALRREARPAHAGVAVRQESPQQAPELRRLEHLAFRDRTRLQHVINPTASARAGTESDSDTGRPIGRVG